METLHKDIHFFEKKKKSWWKKVCLSPLGDGAVTLPNVRDPRSELATASVTSGENQTGTCSNAVLMCFVLPETHWLDESHVHCSMVCDGHEEWVTTTTCIGVHATEQSKPKQHENQNSLKTKQQKPKTLNNRKLQPESTNLHDQKNMNNRKNLQTSTPKISKKKLETSTIQRTPQQPKTLHNRKPPQQPKNVDCGSVK